MTRYLGIFVFLFTAFCSSSAFAFENPETNAVPGGIFIAPLPISKTRPVVHYGDKRVMVIKDDDQWWAIFGIPLAAKPGNHHLIVEGEDNIKRKLGFHISDKTYESQYITLKNKRMVNPEKHDMKRILREQKEIRRALANWDDRTPDTMRFELPVNAPMSSRFGLRRFFNKQPRKPHSGLDLAAPAGTDIHAPSAGIVSATGDYYFNGNHLWQKQTHG